MSRAYCGLVPSLVIILIALSLTPSGGAGARQKKQSQEEAIEEALRAEVVIYAIGIGDQDVDGVDRKALERLCEPTGGRAFVPRDVEDLDQAFGQLEQELRQQYLVAYEPANVAADGKFRKIEARIANRKGIRVRHRRGYYAPST